MTELEYIRTLENKLHSLPHTDREDLLQDYRDHFREGRKVGKNDFEIAKDLGDPDRIARMIIAEYSIDSVEDKSGKKGSVGTAIISIIGLSFFNLIISLPFFIVLYALVLALYAVAVAFVASPFIVVYLPYLVDLPFSLSGLQVLLFSLGLFFVGLAIFFMSRKIWSSVLRITIRFLRWNIDVIKRD
ncbi:DUF1700 domain-containing protein [uncultured Mesotoga sp.]|jgi:uncharacterized membrane protein|uniref:DUF1700 domain-containing protein n=1 Tax=uncultured Mesotoga sp. TaxID=1184400 RepID=UPI0025967C74|nr:DUF1700 domain-containing protein [uncultured Mesotoga sp.]